MSASLACNQSYNQFEISKKLIQSGFFSQIKLSPSARLVLLTLASYNNFETEKCYPSIDTLIHNTGLTKQSIISAIKQLVDKQIISVKKLDGKNFYFFRSIFYTCIGQNFRPNKIVNKINNKSSYRKKCKANTQNDDDFQKSNCKGLLNSSKTCNNSTVQLETKERLKKLGFTDSDKIISRYEIEQVKRALNYVENNKVNNPGAYVRKLLSNDYMEDMLQKVKSVDTTKELIKSYESVEKLSCPPPIQLFSKFRKS